MTKNESFKKRIRTRMATTGERYTAARKILLTEAAASGERRWVSKPDLSEEAITTNTARGWNEWCDVIDAARIQTEGHTAIAAYLRDTHGIDPWWAQAVTVGYERITGLRLPYQRPDGTFTADKSKIVAVDAVMLRALLLDSDGRDDLFAGKKSDLRSKPSSKGIRLQIGPGVVLISLDAAPDNRTKVVVSHERLPAFSDVAEWKFFWNDWLEALDEIT